MHTQKHYQCSIRSQPPIRTSCPIRRQRKPIQLAESIVSPIGMERRVGCLHWPAPRPLYHVSQVSTESPTTVLVSVITQNYVLSHYY